MICRGRSMGEGAHLAVKKRNSRRTYGIALIIYAAVCVSILTMGILDARGTVKAYNEEQAKLVSGLLVENVNVALDNAVAQVEEVCYAIAGGKESDPDVIYEELSAYAGRADIQSIGFVDEKMSIYGLDGDYQDLVKLGFLKQMMEAEDTIMTDPYRSRISAENVITISVPVYKNEKRTGTVYANFPLQKLQEFANIDDLNGEARIYLINCRSLNCIICTDSGSGAAGTWNNLALQRANMEFESRQDFQFYISRMQNGVKGDTLSYRVDGVDYTQGYERISKMSGWYLAVELSNGTLSDSFDAFQSKLTVYAAMLLLATVAVCAVLILMEVWQKKTFEKLSTTDAMTGLYNKKTFTALVEEYLRGEKKPGVLIFVDVDNFKIYNDNYGHLNGDAVLKKFAKELQAEFGAVGVIGRYGGDEFIIFLKNISGKSAVEQSIGRLRGQLASMELEGFGEVSLGFSSGGARFPQDGTDFKELCRLADEALYRVKEDGKGKFYWYQ